ncbi:MAG: phosphatase PAP2 family protein, partial [Bryobacterales bacterium]|nr:phosphatase PAP2 family protein [Bryobacterales bacterium]
YGIHLSVFPSAHCSGSMAAALAMKEIMPHQPWIWRPLLILAISIAIATVYGRYHYAADAAAGIAVAIVAWQVGRRVALKG